MVAASMIGCDSAPHADQATASDGRTETHYGHGSTYFYYGGAGPRSAGQAAADGSGGSNFTGDSSGSSKSGTSRGGFGSTGSGKSVYS